MVEPLSLVALSAIGGIVIGKFTKKENKIEIVEREGIEFIAIKENINLGQLLPFLKGGKSIFLNISKVKQDNSFISNIQEFATENEFKLNKVSEDLLYITPLNQKINIRTLVKQEKLPRKLEIEINGS